MTTQRQLPTATPLPCCSAGHATRHIHDVRRAEAGGGHFIECQCRHTTKHAEFDQALDQWCRDNGHPTPRLDPIQRPLPLVNVTQLRITR